MADLSAASEIARNVWLGSTIDPSLGPAYKKQKYECCIEAADNFQSYDAGNLNEIGKLIGNAGPTGIVEMQAPGSGTINPDGDQDVIDRLILLIRWVYKLANSSSKSKPARRFLIHCADGYTESTMFALAYFMYVEALTAPEAYVRMHLEQRRNFFAYAGDKHLLHSIQARLIQASPKNRVEPEIPKPPSWFEKMDGSLPSRILPYLYLGNLPHASNPGLLKELGIKRVLSVGEPISWNKEMSSSDIERSSWPGDSFLYIDGVQDNGIDPLTNEFGRCLEFIGESCWLSAHES